MSVGSLRERKKLETWHALRGAALELIQASGYEAVTIEDIALGAGVSKRTFFNYFASKEAVVFDPGPAEPELWERLAGDRPIDEPIWMSLEAFFLGYLDAHRHQLPLQKRLIASSPTLAQNAKATSAEFERFLTAWVAGRIEPRADARYAAAVVTNAALAVLNVAFFTWRPERGVAEFDALIRRGFDCVAEFNAAEGRVNARQPFGGQPIRSRRDRLEALVP